MNTCMFVCVLVHVPVCVCLCVFKQIRVGGYEWVL